MTLQDFNDRYIYKLDKNYDDWTPCKLVDNKYYGDCESYVLSLLQYKLADGDITWTTINGEGHVVLVSNGMFIDCNNKRWTPLMYRSNSYGKFRRMFLVEVLIRKLKGRVLSWFYRDR